MALDSRVTLEDFEHVRDATLRRLLAHWLDMRADGLMPERRAIDPIDFAWALPIVWLCDYIPERKTFRYRLAGEEINRVYGRNLAGLELEDFIPAGALETIRHRYLAVAEGKVILHTAGNIYLLHARTYLGERLILPLCDAQGAVTHVMGATSYRLRGELPADAGPPDQITVATALLREEEQDTRNRA